ncbi:MAG: UDP-3-O-(3-hydroxymyristoyl)glucosamine N-acyltransferase [Pseudomonadota bacterium]
MIELTIQDILRCLQQHAAFDDLVCDDNASDHLSHTVHQLNPVERAQSHDVSCVFSPTLYDHLSTANAGLVITSHEAPPTPAPSIRVKDVYLAYAVISQLFVVPTLHVGVHPTASVSDTATLGNRVIVEAYAVIEGGVILGDDVHIGAHCTVARNARIGAGTRLHPYVSIYHDVLIGQRCEIHSGAVIGADGFGFAPNSAPNHGSFAWQKIAQLGSVHMGDDVSIGANTTIDRGAMEHTVIGHGVIIDNLVMIAHNVRIGDYTAIAGCVGIAGSTTVGRYCRLAGGTGLAGHIHLTDHVVITGMTMVTKSIQVPGSYSGGTSFQETTTWRKNAVRFARLDKTIRKLIG